MIRVGALIPETVDGNRSGRACTGRRVGERDVERAGGLVLEAREVRIDRNLCQHCRAFGRRSGEEMRIRGWRDVEAAHRIRARPGARLIGESLKRQPRTRPAKELTRIERVDLRWQRRDEIVIEGRVVILDHRHGLRRERPGCPSQCGERGTCDRMDRGHGRSSFNQRCSSRRS